MERFLNDSQGLGPMANIRSEISKLETACEDLKRAYDPSAAEERLTELEAQMADQTAKEKEYKEHGKLSSKVSKFSEILDEASKRLDFANLVDAEQDAELEELARNDLQDSMIKAQEFIVEQKLTGTHDENNAIISIKAGSCQQSQVDFIAQAYQKYAKKKGMRVEIIDEGDADITFRIEGENAYGLLRGEHGTHKIVEYNLHREKKQSATVDVQVEPEVEQDEIRLKEDDLEYFSLGASSPGGQNANRNMTGIRIKHRPTGKTATSRLKSRTQNLRLAKKVLLSRVTAHYLQSQESTITNEQERGSRFVRIYDHTNGEVMDKRLENRPTGEFAKGDINAYILAYHGVNFDI